MHELSICQSMLKQVQQLAAENHASAVTAINLTIGPLSGIEPRLLSQAFPVASKNTIAADARLVIETAPVKVYCTHCATESDVSANNLSCAHCGDNHTQLLGGNEMLLTNVELEVNHV